MEIHDCLGQAALDVEMRRQFLNPAELPNWEDTFSQVVTIEAGGVRTIFVSGQVSVDEKKSVMGAGDLATQARQAFSNLRLALNAGGATTSDVVKMNIYIVDYKPSDAPIISEALRTAFQQTDLPASTWLGVKSLAVEGLLIEIDAVAVVVNS